MKREFRDFLFKNSGERELNDIVFPGPPFELLYHSYTFAITPRSKFWRFGFRLSKNKVVEFNPAGRYVNPQYPDLQIAVGDRPSGIWIRPNKIELGNYHYIKGHENENPFNVCDTYEELSPVAIDLKHDYKSGTFIISYNAKGCPPFEKQIQTYEYKYFKIFAWADFIDFELECKIRIVDHRYLSLPTIPVTEFDVKWLKLIYEKFNNSVAAINEYEIKDLWKKDFPPHFNPKGINPLLVISGTEITLYGIYHIDPMSPIFENFDLVILAIRKIFEERSIPQNVTSKEVHELLPNLSEHEIQIVFKLIRSIKEFSRGSSILSDSTYTITVNDPEVLQEYRKYSNLQDFLFNYLKELDEIKIQDLSYASQAETAPIFNPYIGRTPLQRSSETDLTPVMGVVGIASFLAEIIEGLRGDKGQMIGIFAKWGRGKTTLLNELFKFLTDRKKSRGNAAIQYSRVDYHAWKYQETPASWAYLYEVLADGYLGPKPAFWSFEYYSKMIRLNYSRHKIWPLISFFFGVVATVTLPIFSSYHFKDKILFWLGIAPTFLITALSILRQLRKPLSTKAIDLVKKYGIRHSFKEALGMQAAIQDELIVLIKTWVPEKDIHAHKILLFVEDVDRCTEEKIIENIDALRVMVDNAEIAKRLIVLTAVDERILKNAIRIKYEKLTPPPSSGKSGPPIINQLVSEYLDKLFISAIKLGELTIQQKDEYVRQLLEKHLIKTIGRKPASSNDAGENIKEASVGPSDSGQDKNVQGEEDSARNKNALEAKSFPVIAIDSNITLGEAVAEKLEGLTEQEMIFFLSAVESWEQATPRTISIFYYRYLLCKNLLISQYRKSGAHNIWQDESSVKGLMSVILDYTVSYDPSKIIIRKQEVIKQKELERISIAKDSTLVERADYLRMLEILEIIIAY